MTIGEQIRQKRKTAGITMAELGKRIGVTAAAISRYELGQRDLTMDTLQAIADALDVHIFDLVGIGEKLKMIKIEAGNIVPLSGNPEDLPPEKKAEIMNAIQSGPQKLYDYIPNEGKKEFWQAIFENDSVPRFSLSSKRERLNEILDQMNEDGHAKVVVYAEDILPRYRRQDAPQPPAEASRDTDTPTPEEPAEGPPEASEGTK